MSKTTTTNTVEQNETLTVDNAKAGIVVIHRTRPSMGRFVMDREIHGSPYGWFAMGEQSNEMRMILQMSHWVIVKD